LLYEVKILPSSEIILNKTSNFKVTITEMYPQLPWELVADPLGSAEHTLGITAPGQMVKQHYDKFLSAWGAFQFLTVL
jgi:hypothetical protein